MIGRPRLSAAAARLAAHELVGVFLAEELAGERKSNATGEEEEGGIYRRS